MNRGADKNSARRTEFDNMHELLNDMEDRIRHLQSALDDKQAELDSLSASRPIVNRTYCQEETAYQEPPIQHRHPEKVRIIPPTGFM